MYSKRSPTRNKLERFRTNKKSTRVRVKNHVSCVIYFIQNHKTLHGYQTLCHVDGLLQYHVSLEHSKNAHVTYLHCGGRIFAGIPTPNGRGIKNRNQSVTRTF